MPAGIMDVVPMLRIFVLVAGERRGEERGGYRVRCCLS